MLKVIDAKWGEKKKFKPQGVLVTLSDAAELLIRQKASLFFIEPKL